MMCKCLTCGRMFAVKDPGRTKSFNKCPDCAERETPDVVRDMLDSIMLDQYRHNKEFRKKRGLQ